MHSLQVLGPWRRVRHGHEEAVGEYREHYKQAEQSGKVVKEKVAKGKLHILHNFNSYFTIFSLVCFSLQTVKTNTLTGFLSKLGQKEP